MSSLIAPPPLVAISQLADGSLVASRMTFAPASAITPQDIFSQGMPAWATKFKFPYIGGLQNEVWTSQIINGSNILMIYICDYVPWNVPCSLHYKGGQAQIKHLRRNEDIPANGFIDGRGNSDNDKASINFQTRVQAKELGYDKCIIFKFSPYSGGVLDLDLKGDASSSEAGATSVYLGLVDLGKKALVRMPMTNIHDNGKICLVPYGSHNAITPRPDPVFAEFAASMGNLDLASDSNLTPLYLEPIPDTEDEAGVPWLDLKTEKPGQRYGGMSLTVPNFWAPFEPLIQQFLDKKEKGEPKAKKEKAEPAF